LATVDVTVLNPKSMQISELYGAINPDTLEFSDGMVMNISLINGFNLKFLFSLLRLCVHIQNLMNLK
jgi:hypothetical protein